MNMPDKSRSTQEDKKKEFLEYVEHKIKKSEKEIWFVKNHDHLMEKDKY